MRQTGSEEAAAPRQTKKSMVKKGKLHRACLALDLQELENPELSGVRTTVVDEELLKINNFPELGGLRGED